MSTKTLLPSSSHITDRYFFRTHSNDTRISSKTKSDGTLSPKRIRYKFSSNNNTESYPNVYNFSINQNEKRSHSSDSNRYYFSLENKGKYPSQTLTYLRSGVNREPRSVTFNDGTSTFRSDTPYFFSTTTYPHLEDTWTPQRRRISPSVVDSSLRARSISPEYRQSTRMDTVTSTNGLLSVIKRPPIVHFEPSLLSPSARSYLNEARERLSGRYDRQSLESFEKSVDRLVSSVNKKYGQQQTITSPSTSSSSNYISQYYAKEDERIFDSDDDEQHKHSYNLNINRTHTQIMKSLNKSLIDRSYHIDRNRLKIFEENLHRYLRLFESQSLERELNYGLIRCFSSSYLQDLRQEEIRQYQIRSQKCSYTYEDIQDIHVPSILEAYKMKVSMNRERQQLSISTGQLSPISLSGYSPIKIGSSNEYIDTHSGGFETDRRSTASISQISTGYRPNVDIFYEIMQESFRGIDASIAGHVSKVSQSHRTTDVDIKSNSSFWSDDELVDQYFIDTNQRKSIPNQRKISRYLSTVNRSLLDRPSDLIADFYLSQLNRNMQESVQHIENIARDKADQQESLNKYERSLSAEHLYQVRKEHLRYKQPFTRPTSFTMEDVTDIYKPFVLENYKRKIAIELERRRKERRQGHLISSSSMCTLDTNLTPQVSKSIHRPRTYNDFSMVSPPIIVQTKEIIMGRARRTLTNDGSSDVIQHISGISPPPIYSIHQPSPSLQTNIRITTTIDPPDFIVRNRKDELQRLHTQIPQINTVRISRANRIESDSDSLSMANIEPIVTLNQYEMNALSNQSIDGQIQSYIEQKPKPQRSTLIISLEEHLSTMHESIPITEIIPITNLSIPSRNKAHEISGDSEVSLNISRTHEPPIVFHSPYTQVMTNEPLPEIHRTVIRNDILDVESVSLASLLEELNSTKYKHHATSIIDDNYYWKTCDKVEENVRIPIVVYDTEWTNEEIEEFSLNIQHAQYKYQNIQYEHATINLPFFFGIQSILDTNEQLRTLSDNSTLLRHEQQSNIRIDQPLQLENPVHTTDLLTLNYPYYNQNFSINSQTSSFIDMETFLNNFEESIDHEQHLPLINQISVSYAASMNDQRNDRRHPSLPIEWFQPTTISLHDEQLVEQWTMENNLDTIQHEGTLHRRQVDFLINNDYENMMTDAFCKNEQFEEGEISHCSPTSDYETDSVEKDNETLIIPLTILPSSSITNLTLLSQSSSHLTSHTAPIAPIVYFLDVLALEEKEQKNSTKDFLLTLGFGQNQMNEITNTVATSDQPLRPRWINRSLTDNIEILPTSIHHENQSIYSSNNQQIHFAIEHQIEEDDTALLIYSHRLQFGHDLGENTQAPLTTFYEPTYLHLPMINEIYKYQMSFHREFPNFYPPDTLPHILVSKIHDDEIFSPDVCQINQPEILAYAQINYILDNREEIQPISVKLDQSTYIEHYHIQSLFPCTETYYVDINQTDILIDHNQNDFLSNFILIKPSQREDDDFLRRFMRPITDNNQYSQSNIIKSKSSVEVRPSVSPESDPISEEVKIHQHVQANMGPKGQYERQEKFTYGTEHDRSKYSPFERTSDSHQVRIVQQDDVYVPETVIEHISEDEKSTSSEEVVFEEWTEEFRCRRTDEYDRKTNQLLRTTIDETSDRIKGDVIKEQYKEKNTRIKGHKSYDVVKEVRRRIPGRTYEEIPKPPPRSSSIPPRASSRDRQWTSEEIYTTEIVQDPAVVRDLESTAQKFESITHYEHTRPSQISPIQTTISTYPSSRYDHMSNVVTPTAHYAEQRKQEQPEDVVSEEYQVEVETTIPKRDQTSGDNRADTYVTTESQSPTTRNSDWRSKLREIYTATSDEDQYKDSTNGSYLAQRVPVIPSSTQQRFKEVQIRLPGHDRTPPEQRKFEPSPPLRHTVKEVLVCVSRGSSPEKPYHSSLTDDYEQKRKKTDFLDPESPKKVSSTSPTDDDQPRSSSIVTEQRTPYEPTYSRVVDLKNTFETTTYGSTRDDPTKYKTPISTGFTEQRRRIFEDQEWNRRPINEFQSTERRMSETHTGPSLVSDRISRLENVPSTTDYVSRKGFDTTKTSLPQTSIDIKYRSKQVISSMDSDLSGPTQPIYSSTPKSYKQKQDEDAGHESEDELSDPKQSYDSRRRTSKTRLRDFSQSTQQPIDVTHTVHRATTNLDDMFTQVPITTSKSPLIEPSTQTPGKSHLTSDSGVFDYSTTAMSYQLPTSSPTWRQNVSTTIIGDTPRSRDNGIYVDSTIISSPYGRRQTPEAEQTTTQNIDESISRSTYKYDREIPSTQYQQQQQRTVRRQLTNSPPTEYEHLTSYQSRLDAHSKVPITTQSRTIKPLVVDEYETVETKTQVDCQVQRTNEIKESTTTERVASPSRKILTITTTATASHSSDETTPARRVLLNEQPQYYELPKDERQFQPIQRDHSQDDLIHSSTMEVTSLSPTDQIKFGKKSPNEIIAVVRVPELSKSTIRHGTSESNLYEKSREEDRPRLNYQRVHATSYRPPIFPQVYQSRQSRLRNGSFENANDYSSPITIPVRSTSSHSNLHEQKQQQQIYRPQTRYHSGSLSNLLGSNLEFEIEIEKRPPQQPEQPTSVSLDQGSRAIVTTSKDGRVSVQNIAAYPGNTVVINSDYHSSDRSLNRSSGYFSSDEPRSQGGHTTNYSSDEQSSGAANRNSSFTSSPIRHYRTNEQTPITNGTRYHFDRVNEIVQNYSRSTNNFNDAIDQIDALYTNLDVKKNDQRPYDFSKLNRRKQLTQNPNEYSSRYTSTGFQQIPYEQPTSSSMPTPLRPSQSLSSSGILTDYGTPGSGYGSIQNLVQQNRLNNQSQVVQRNRISVKQVKQKNAAKRRNGNIQGQYSDGDDDDENDSPLSDNGRSQPSPRSYNYYQ